MKSKSENENMLLIPSKKKGESKVNITFRNELTIFSIEDIKDKVVNAVTTNDQIDFVLKDVKNMDLSFIQLIYSIKLTAKKYNKKVSFNISLSDDLMNLFINSGLGKLFE